MKMMIEKHICDVCGCEVTTEQRHTVELGVFNNWSDDAKINKQIKKDLCCNCYETLMGLINAVEAKEEPKPAVEEKPRKRSKRTYDKEELLKLWAMGLKHHEIAKNLNIGRSTVANAIWQASDEEKEEAKNKYGVHRNRIKEEPEVRVVTDEYGIVQSIERV